MSKRVLIIDDEPLARMVVREYLLDFPDLEVMAECGDGFEGIKAVNQYKPDLIFLDVQMPKINGFEMLELLDPQPAVIFATAFDEYAIKAFEAHAVDYLLKPFSKDRLHKAVEKYLGQNPIETKKHTEQLLESPALSPSQHDRIVVKTGTKVKIIPVADVLYLEADDDYVSIHTAEGSFLKNKTMGFFEQTLDPRQFVRVHRSYIVSIPEITRIDPYEKDAHLAILRSGAKVPVSKSGYTKLKQVLGI
ncbi:LytR/AlgR family response regulator transcription factor [Mucilaginibacter myungsuensis]|uniref:LytTR family transcriptional regulator DNA-binding domain-containing protein n=1 Tax=Mucilaginibacter myungsuensis TaxID=649104 RepID=A0A929L134_9SPHI|nr:LytTR family transcriptional regulator DNA-binding domain-containing protein [Mucilaginibacter myungsuensis]MBE9662564.1 LytTR family transcriptional regulator DNA-binding domain-containing protein [Mucilaginibacter myungsuensis]MDN3597984.1 LytTR family transcriptional regulator DNA-binding domain-containing protein [Mucilaginibacter myungsuensis]